MSKSLGNFVTIRELLGTPAFGGNRWSGEVLRLAMLMTHYREPINWTINRLEEVRHELAEWTRSMIERVEAPYPVDFARVLPDDETISALQDDINTPKAITRLRSLHKLAHAGDLEAKAVLARTLNWLGVYRRAYHFAYYDDLPSATNIRVDLIWKFKNTVSNARALLLNESVQTQDAQMDPRRLEALVNELYPNLAIDGVRIRLGAFNNITLEPISDYAKRDQGQIERLVDARNAARKAKNFKEADRIRDELTAMGIQLKDAKDPATGEIVTTWEVRASGTTEAKR